LAAVKLKVTTDVQTRITSCVFVVIFSTINGTETESRRFISLANQSVMLHESETKSEATQVRFGIA